MTEILGEGVAVLTPQASAPSVAPAGGLYTDDAGNWYKGNGSNWTLVF